MRIKSRLGINRMNMVRHSMKLLILMFIGLGPWLEPLVGFGWNAPWVSLEFLGRKNVCLGWELSGSLILCVEFHFGLGRLVNADWFVISHGRVTGIAGIRLAIGDGRTGVGKGICVGNGRSTV